MKRPILFALISLIAALPAHAVNVVTSIKPIQMITNELTKGITEPDVIVQNNASPHDYALRPSDIKKVVKADLVLWYGEDLEGFLEKVLENRSNVLTISQIPGLALRKFEREEHEHEHEHEHEDEHEHEGHHHGIYDPHFWLGVKTTGQVADVIAHKLAKIDSDNAEKYLTNLKEFEDKLHVTDQVIMQQLSPIQDAGYFVFHDAYGYFEERYDLNQLGRFTVSPERKPGAKTLNEIHQILKKGEGLCVFAEPQFTPQVLESVMRGSNARLGSLDPLGSDIEVKNGSYFTFLNGMAASFTQCLSTK